jgi:hypothetical protein
MDEELNPDDDVTLKEVKLDHDRIIPPMV